MLSNSDGILDAEYLYEAEYDAVAGPIKGYRKVRPPKRETPKDNFGAVSVAGDYLAHEGILDGDILIVRLTRVWEAGHLYVFDTPNGRTAKFAEKVSRGKLRLFNKKGWEQTWRHAELKLVGIVVRVERDLNEVSK